MSYKILRIYSIPYTHIYSDFLEKDNKIKNLKYKEIQENFFTKKISYSDVFSRNMKKLGNKSEEIIINFEYLQNQWAKENIKSNTNKLNNNLILEMQIEKFQP